MQTTELMYNTYIVGLSNSGPSGKSESMLRTKYGYDKSRMMLFPDYAVLPFMYKYGYSMYMIIERL